MFWGLPFQAPFWSVKPIVSCTPRLFLQLLWVCLREADPVVLVCRWAAYCLRSSFPVRTWACLCRWWVRVPSAPSVWSYSCRCCVRDSTQCLFPWYVVSFHSTTKLVFTFLWALFIVMTLRSCSILCFPFVSFWMTIWVAPACPAVPSMNITSLHMLGATVHSHASTPPLSSMSCYASPTASIDFGATIVFGCPFIW